VLRLASFCQVKLSYVRHLQFHICKKENKYRWKNIKIRLYFFLKIEICGVEKYIGWRVIALNDLPESEDFVTGISVGIAIHQQKVLTAYKRKESLKKEEKTKWYKMR